MEEFEIHGDELYEYHGPGGDAVIPAGVRTIGIQAFANHTSLRSVAIPMGVSNLKAECFRGCTSLTSVTLPDSVVLVGDGVFHGCTRLSSVTLSKAMLSLPAQMFFGCSSLREVTLPNGIKRIYEVAFGDCTALTTVKAGGLVFASYDAFEGCERFGDLQTSTLSFGAVWKDWTLEQRTVYCCNRLAAGLPLQSKESYFVSCAHGVIAALAVKRDTPSVMEALLARKRSVTPDELDAMIADSEGAPKVRAFLVEFKSRRFSADELETYERLQTEKELGLRRRTVADWKRIFRLTIRNGTVTITGLRADTETIEIPERIGRSQVTAIADDAFRYCTRLTAVTIPDSVCSFGDGVFHGCTALTSVTLPKTLRYVPWRAFYGCSSLRTVTLPAGIRWISQAAFEGCRSLTEITFPEGMFAIGEGAFRDCVSLASVVLPDSMSQIEAEAFRRCRALCEVRFPPAVKVAQDAFRDTAWQDAQDSPQ